MSGERSRTTPGASLGGGPISRRQLLEDAAVAAAAASVAGVVAREANASPPRPLRQRRRVAIIGAGPAGLTAAHELAERGFEVTVWERKALGGKARSMPVKGTARGGRSPLPGEHGFRFFPGFYHHVPETMRRIPFAGNANGVWDNLVGTPETRLSRNGGRQDMRIPLEPDPGLLDVNSLRQTLTGALQQVAALPPHELEFFVNRLLVFLTSSDERRYGEWEHVDWKAFVRAEGKSEEYQRFLSGGLTRALVAAKEHLASTRTIGNMAEAFVYNIMGRGNDGVPDRVLNAPTNEAWIDPWVGQLRELGVRFRVGYEIESLDVRRGRIESARARGPHGRRRVVDADWFVCAIPAERARQLWSREILRLDPALEAMSDLFVDWMTGIQFYLKREAPLAKGHLAFMDSQWAITALTQGQFWESRDFTRDYGDGSVCDCLSVDVSDWDTPGIVYGKPAKRCRKPQIAREVWEQIKDHVNDTGAEQLSDDMLHSWFLDPAIRWSPATRRNRNDEKLLINTAGSWELRPQARTQIANLFLAGDYVQTDIDLATMEGANESARAAVNALLDTVESNAERCAMYKLYDPPEFEALKRIDQDRYRAGRPNLLDRA